MERFNVYCLKKMWVGLLGWIVLSFGAMSYADLFKAVEQGNIAEIRLLLNNNPSQAFITQVNDQGQTVLHRASSSQDDRIDIVELLLDKVNHALTQDLVIEFMLQADKNGATASRIASEKGHVAVVKALLRQYRDLDKKQPDRKMRTRLINDFVMSLFYACSEGQINLVRSLLASQVFNHVISKIRAIRNGWTPLHAASERGHIEVVNALLAHNPSSELVMHVNNDGQTALHLAAANGHVGLVNVLLAHNASLQLMMQKDKNGNRAARMAFDKGHIAVVEALIDKYKLILEQPAGPNSNDVEYDMAMSLFYACRDGQMSMLQLLLSKVTNFAVFNRLVKIFQFSTNGSTLLHVASERGHVEVVNALLAHNLSSELVMQVNNDGQTALYLAAANGHVGVVNVLLAHNASLQLMMQKDKNGNRAGHIAIASEKGHIAVVEALIDKYKLILEQPAGPNSNDVEYDMAMFLFYACRDSRMSVLELLLSKVTNLAVFNRLVKNFESWSNGLPPLHLAAANGHVEAVNALLAYNPSPDFVTQVTNQGQTALHVACYYGHLKIVEILVSAEPMLLLKKNGFGASALEIALERGKNEIADYLAQKIIEYGATLNPKTAILPIASFAILNADIAQHQQKVAAFHRQQTALDVTAKAISSKVASLQKQLDQEERKLHTAQVKCKHNEKECEDGEKELENKRRLLQENKNKLSELCNALDAQQKNKRPSPNGSQELSVSVKQETENYQEARMRNFYEDLNEDQLMQVAEKARGKSVATKNCVHLAKAIIDFLRTGHAPTGIASEEDSTHRDFQTLLEYEAMPSGSGRSSKRKKFEHVVESTVVDLGAHEDSMPGRYMLHLELDEQGNIAHSCEEIDLSHRDVPSHRVAFDKLDEILKQQAKRRHPDKIAFGLINLGRVRAEGDIHIPVGHQFVYFARPSVVYLIDPQNRSNDEGEMVFSGTSKWKTSYLNKVKEIFGEYAFVVPMTMNF